MPRIKPDMTAPSQETKRGAGKNVPQAVDWEYSTAIKIFNLEDSVPAPLSSLALAPMHPDQLLKGYLCQAARELLGVSQAWLWLHASVSKKTINDFENGFTLPKAALIARLRQALEGGGASFVQGHKVMGVIVYRRRSDQGLSSQK